MTGFQGVELKVDTQLNSEFKMKDEGDDDNILRPQSQVKKVTIDKTAQKDSSPTSDSDESPTSPGAFGSLTTAKYKEEVSIEIQVDEE